ncbi:hypothetical protein FA13DRAFT_1737555 [Coprinellus micaceus]|uniref:Uncharacterized protein n=1 Tax=Coprinellus micaceus TaxID=71717 RepID=A0A4Y7R6A6_COPMI|nr:hypothetical protein FA13DRAFT_1750556 [Coprinellus micaceus]TEB26376.1 hypothetical protein FA13DRAFT_1737555 [Coprinellus micaceus]
MPLIVRRLSDLSCSQLRAHCLQYDTICVNSSARKPQLMTALAAAYTHTCESIARHIATYVMLCSIPLSVTLGEGKQGSMCIYTHFIPTSTGGKLRLASPAVAVIF